MPTKLELLDKALDMSEVELGYLVEGDVDKAEQASLERGDLIRRILSMDDGASQEQLLDKLTRLRNMQSRLTAEARKLHDQLRTDLTRAKQENKRHAGYANSSRVRSMTGGQFSGWRA
jgi:hypothetical protein